METFVSLANELHSGAVRLDRSFVFRVLFALEQASLQTNQKSVLYYTEEERQSKSIQDFLDELRMDQIVHSNTSQFVDHESFTMSIASSFIEMARGQRVISGFDRTLLEEECVTMLEKEEAKEMTETAFQKDSLMAGVDELIQQMVSIQCAIRVHDHLSKSHIELFKNSIKTLNVFSTKHLMILESLRSKQTPVDDILSIFPISRMLEAHASAKQWFQRYFDKQETLFQFRTRIENFDCRVFSDITSKLSNTDVVSCCLTSAHRLLMQLEFSCVDPTVSKFQFKQIRFMFEKCMELASIDMLHARELQQYHVRFLFAVRMKTQLQSHFDPQELERLFAFYVDHWTRSNQDVVFTYQTTDDFLALHYYFELRKRVHQHPELLPFNSCFKPPLDEQHPCFQKFHRILTKIDHHFHC